jgi:hypothetical protein
MRSKLWKLAGHEKLKHHHCFLIPKRSYWCTMSVLLSSWDALAAAAAAAAAGRHSAGHDRLLLRISTTV